MVRHFLVIVFIKKISCLHYLSPHSPQIFQCFIPTVHCLKIIWWLKNILSLHQFSKLLHGPLHTQRIKSRFFSQAFRSSPTCDSARTGAALSHAVHFSCLGYLQLGAGSKTFGMVSNRPRVRCYLWWEVTG